MKQYSFKRVYRIRWAYRFMFVFFLLLAIIYSIWTGASTYYNNLNKPIIIKTAADYYQAVEDDSYVKIYVNKFYDLGVGITETTTDDDKKAHKSTKSRFVAVNVDKKLLVISLHIDQYEEFMKQKKAPYMFEGKIAAFEDGDLNYITNSLVTNTRSFGQASALLYLNCLNYQSPSESASLYFILAIMVGILILVMFVPNILRNANALKKLEKYSNVPIDEVYKQIDDEVNFPTTHVYKNRPVTITKRYIIVETRKITFAMPLCELTWAYKCYALRLFHGIPTGKTYSLVLVFSDKSTYKVEMSEKKIDDILQYMSVTADKTFVGYSKEIAHIYKRNFAQFISEWQNHHNNQQDTMHI